MSRNKRTKFDSNEIIECESYFKIYTYDKFGNINNVGLFDKDDIGIISKHKWFSDKQGYMATRISKDGARKRISMHRLIMNMLDSNEILDHINQNKSDNRKQNLRVSDDSKNEINKSISSNNKSGIRGVSWDRSRNKWYSETVTKLKRIRKRFLYFDEAVAHRIKVESIYFKEFSPNYSAETNTIQLTYTSHDDNLKTFIEVDLQGNILKFEKLEGDQHDSI